MNRKILKIDEMIQGEAAFVSSPRIRRSPVMKPQTAKDSACMAPGDIGAEKSNNVPKNAPETPRLQDTQPSQQETAEPLPELSSPRHEFIFKMRRSEEETLAKCFGVIRKMRLGMAKQKNISLEVKNGVSELEELMDVMKNYRRSWKAAEKEKEKEASRIPTSTREDKAAENTYTPVTSLKKRGASSPAEIRPEKKAREKTPEKEQTKEKEREEEWKMVRSKKTINKEKKQRRKAARERPDAVIIHPSEGRSYSDVLRNIRSNVKPEETEISIRTVRKTRTGAILIEMGKGGRREEFRENLKSILNQDAVVKDLTPMATLEIRDLDALTTTEEVLAAVEKEIGEKLPDTTIRLTAANSWEQKRAFVSIPAGCANTLLKSQRIKIGWTRCRIIIRKEPVRCFRCFATGHRQWKCEGPDRKSLCIKCGEEGHKKKDCRNTPKFCICSAVSGRSTDHLAGSRQCEAGEKKTK